MENVCTGVLDENKEHILRCTDKVNKLWCIKTYTITYVKIPINDDLHSIMSSLQPNCCLKANFQKVDQPTEGKWFIHDTKRQKDNQLQSLRLLCRTS